MFMPPLTAFQLDFQRNIPAVPGSIQARNDIFPIGNAVKREKVQIVQPCDFLPAHAKIVIQMRAYQTIGILPDKVMAMIITYFMPRIDTKAQGGMSAKMLHKRIKILFAFDIFHGDDHTRRSSRIKNFKKILKPAIPLPIRRRNSLHPDNCVHHNKPAAPQSCIADATDLPSDLRFSFIVRSPKFICPVKRRMDRLQHQTFRLNFGGEDVIGPLSRPREKHAVPSRSFQNGQLLFGRRASLHNADNIPPHFKSPTN